MRPFKQHSGVLAPLLRDNVDTDAIIPSREMKRVSKSGLADGLFAGWRYLNPVTRELNHEFVLNQSQYQGASIILSGKNFGCGSSREHAVWALAEYGIRAVLAESFGAIFYTNCIRNGVLPIQITTQDSSTLAALVAEHEQATQLEIQLDLQTLSCADQFRTRFDIRAADKEMLLLGLDPIDVSTRFVEQLAEFEQQHFLAHPWVRM